MAEAQAREAKRQREERIRLFLAATEEAYRRHILGEEDGEEGADFGGGDGSVRGSVRAAAAAAAHQS